MFDKKRRRLCQPLFLLSCLVPCVLGWVSLPGSYRNPAFPPATSIVSASSRDASFPESILDVPEGDRAIQDFLTHVQESVETGHFVSFTLRGPSNAEKGTVRRISGRSVAIHEKEVIQATFKYHGATDICKNWNVIDCVPNLNAILLSSSTLRNIVPASEWGVPPPTTLGAPSGMQSATLQLSNGTEWELQYQRSNRQIQLTRRKRAVVSAAPLQPHDRTKSGPVDVSHPVWVALGVTTTPAKNMKQNTVKAGMSSKLRQCQKFVEIVQQRIAECWNDDTATPSMSVIDMGCGRGYLTFALHSFLVREYTHVSSRGIDVRPKLVAEISEIAASQSDFKGLRFETGTIESFLAESQSPRSELHDDNNGTLEVIIALHACDTATDDALWSGIARNSDLIVVAPCCHRQVRPQLNHHASSVDDEHPYADVLRHNIYRERIAETITDALRALLLELSGYSVQIFEFIGGEHTSKNVMITAVKKTKKDENKQHNATQKYQDILERIRSLAALHGIKQQRLAKWMGISLSNADKNESLETRAIARTMPRMKRIGRKKI